MFGAAVGSGFAFLVEDGVETELLCGFGVVSGKGDEWPGAFSDCAHVSELLPGVDSGFASVLEDALDADGTEPWCAHKLVAVGAVDVDRECV